MIFDPTRASTWKLWSHTDWWIFTIRQKQQHVWMVHDRKKTICKLSWQHLLNELYCSFSRTNLYGIVGVQGTINSLIFGLFLKQLYDVINSNDPESNDRRVFVMDNASIHKSRHIHSLVKGKQEFWVFVHTKPHWTLQRNWFYQLDANLKHDNFKEGQYPSHLLKLLSTK